MNLPDFSFEEALWRDKFTVIGMDEVGRGAFAGPVGVGGVVFDPQMSTEIKKVLLSFGINDSKKLTSKKREELAKTIKEYALATHVAFVDVATINKIGIGEATFLGMRQVFDNLKKKALKPYLLIDAFTIPNLKVLQKGIVKGDALSISIASASIVAKVTRDKYMDKLSRQYPAYGFDKHKGYGTLYHRKAISDFGLSEHHRQDFCKNYIKLGDLNVSRA